MDRSVCPEKQNDPRSHTNQHEPGYFRLELDVALRQSHMPLLKKCKAKHRTAVQLCLSIGTGPFNVDHESIRDRLDTFTSSVNHWQVQGIRLST